MSRIGQRELDPVMGELFLAGERVSRGHYRDVTTGRVVFAEEGDTLPASLDGRVACYYRARFTWSEMQREWALDARDEREIEDLIAA